MPCLQDSFYIFTSAWIVFSDVRKEYRVVPALGHTAHPGLQELKLKGRCSLSLFSPAMALRLGRAGLGIVLGRAIELEVEISGIEDQLSDFLTL